MSVPKPTRRVVQRYNVQYPNPIEVRAREHVQVGRQDEDNPAWLWCRASNGCEGWMPSELLSQQDGLATVLEDYSAKELGVEPGEEVFVEQVRHGWALVRNAKGERGWLPESCLEA